MSGQRTAVLLGCALALCAAAVPRAAAAQTSHCFITPVSGGVVMLRAGPSAGAAPVARMRSGDEVAVINDQPPATWLRVSHAPGRVAYDVLRRTNPGRIREGYVHRRYLGDCDA